ncbi:hypothetical protein Unana1_07196 [Umbelopsis nana]
MQLIHSTIVSVATVILLTTPRTIAVDPQGWYAANPGLSKIGLVDQSINQITDVHGRNSFGPQDVQNLQDLGVNAVRLGHHWAGAEPVPGKYNQTFLDIMKSQTKLAEDHGIYVLVDVYQDGTGCTVLWTWSAKCQLHFAPSDGLANHLALPIGDNGIPSSSDCSSIKWSVSYLTPAVCNAFGRLYANYDNLGDSFAAYWKKLAQQYVNTNNILGYNLLNEPWVGDSYADPSLLTPGVVDHVNLEGFRNKAAAQIRAVDKNTLVWFEGTNYDVSSGFNNVPLGDGSRTVQSYHYYNPPQVGTIESTYQNGIKDNQRLKTASVLTEHTMWMGDATQMINIQTAVDKADQYMMSWMSWAYENLYDSNQQPYPQIVAHCSRAYPAAVAGIPTKFSFNSNSGSFSLVYTAKKAVTAPTEIVLPMRTYPNGYNVTVTPAGSVVQYVKVTRTLTLFTANGTTDGQSISVTITKK